jgi:hypothetical protein
MGGEKADLDILEERPWGGFLTLGGQCDQGYCIVNSGQGIKGIPPTQALV